MLNAKLSKRLNADTKTTSQGSTLHTLVLGEHTSQRPSYLQKALRLGLSQQTADVPFGFLHVFDILRELLHQGSDFHLTALHLSVQRVGGLVLLSSQHVSHLLILSRYGLLPAGGRVLEGGREGEHDGLKDPEVF